MLKNALLSATVLAGLSASAFAADLPVRRAAPVFSPVPVFTWTGFYIGGHAGYVSTENDVFTTGNQAITTANVNNNFRPARLSIEDEGFIGGGQIGFNYQFGTFVTGVEADISYVDLDKRVTFLSGRTPVDTAVFGQSLNYLGTVRGRLGLAFDRFMIYGTGGFAYGDVNYRADFSGAAGNVLQFQGGRDETATGYTVGGGIEYAITNNVSLKGEYLYYDLGRNTVTVQGVTTANSYTSRFDTEGHIARGGINFRFGP